MNYDSHHLSLLLNISSSLNSSLDLKQVLQTAMKEVVKLLNAERGFIMLAEDGTLTMKVAQNFDSLVIEENREISHSVIKEVFEQGKAVLTVNAMDDERFAQRKSVVMYGLRSVLCVPLKTHNTTIGVIYIDNRWKSGVFTHREMETLSTFANHAAIAIENARLYQNLKSSLEEKLRLQEIIYEEKMKAEIERRTSRYREELAHYIVHDLRNPLTVIFTAFSFLEAEVAVSESRPEYLLLQNAKKNLRILSGMINDILDVYKLESRELTPQKSTFDLAETVRELLKEQACVVPATVKLKYAFSPRKFTLYADKSLIQRVLNNLFQNAARLTRTGYIKISGIRHKSHSVIRVIDTGPGIPEEFREKVFSKFVRVLPKNKESFSKGLGLAFCKLVVEAHQGSIVALPNPNGGTIMEIKLPNHIKTTAPARNNRNN